MGTEEVVDTGEAVVDSGVEIEGVVGDSEVEGVVIEMVVGDSEGEGVVVEIEERVGDSEEAEAATGEEEAVTEEEEEASVVSIKGMWFRNHRFRYANIFRERSGSVVKCLT